MNAKKIVVGSRESTLAVAQAMTVVDYLRKTLPETEIELVTMKTTGDRILDRSLSQVGGKGLFVKELDAALRSRAVDITVHSLKDVPMETAPDLPLICFSKREDPRDVLVLPTGRTEPDPERPIGSASLRRSLQLRSLYSGFEILPVRGNVQTRLRKLDEGQYGALVLAAAGLKRLGLSHRISRYFSADEIIPAAGQGVIAIQGRAGEDYSYLDGYADNDSRLTSVCERAFTAELGGGCTSPVCAYAEITGGLLRLRGLYYDETSGTYRVGEKEGSASDARRLGKELALELRGDKV
ncbi:MAG: hydroxymethylbilane synthase [Oscillospiraceae bacterium]|nr:hydroxymethylbilane synthase [Oscillospiraceae bacterium]